MSHREVFAVKPRALQEGAKIALFSPASPVNQDSLTAGMAELQRLGLTVEPPHSFQSIGYFAGTHQERMMEFVKGTQKKEIAGLIAARGGYGSSHLFDNKFNSRLLEPKCIVGFSDLTALQVYMWQVRQWITFHGPMAAAGFNAGAGNQAGYDEESFLRAVRNTKSGWSMALRGETLVGGTAEGRLLGGCLTLLQTSIGTGWELDTRGAILLLEDRGMKPYQVDRALLHLLQAGKFQEVSGIVFGEFPECETPKEGGPSVRDVCDAILRPLGVPIVFGAPVGHTNRPMLTVPLGVRARLLAAGAG
ncbi:MAG TPA: LD-carboxypeptidase, partial [Candidatus Acidoferrum sp.]